MKGEVRREMKNESKKKKKRGNTKRYRKSIAEEKMWEKKKKVKYTLEIEEKKEKCLRNGKEG